MPVTWAFVLNYILHQSAVFTKKRRKGDLNPQERFVPFYYPMLSIALNANNIKCLYSF